MNKKNRLLLRKVFRSIGKMFIKMRSWPTWLKRILTSLITGLLAFCFLSYWPCDCSLPVALFFTAFAIFIVGADHIVETEDYDKTLTFCGACLKVSVFILLVSIAGYILKILGLFINDASQIVFLNFSVYSEILTPFALLKFSTLGEILEMFALPLLVASAILFILSFFGTFGAALIASEKAYAEFDY